MRVVQVHWHRPVKKHIFTFYQLNAVQRVNRIETAKALINMFVGRKRTAWEMQANFIFRPVLGNVKVKLPNSMIQESLDGFMKLEKKIRLDENFSLFVLTFVFGLISCDLQSNTRKPRCRKSFGTVVRSIMPWIIQFRNRKSLRISWLDLAMFICSFIQVQISCRSIEKKLFKSWVKFFAEAFKSFITFESFKLIWKGT